MTSQNACFSGRKKRFIPITLIKVTEFNMNKHSEARRLIEQ